MSMIDLINGVDVDGEQEVVLDPFADAPTTNELRSMFESYTDGTDAAREASFRDYSYYDGDGQVGKQWRETLGKYDLPPIYINKIRGIVEGHLGVLLGQQVDPEAMPRKEQDTDAAAVATKILRYAADKTKWKQIKTDTVKELFILGAAAVLVECGTTDVFLTPIAFREFCYDPHSRRQDFSDANWMGFAKWITIDDVKLTWPDAPMIQDMQDGVDLTVLSTKGFEKNPDGWVDKKNRRVQVVTMYYRENGKWFYVAWCHAGILDWSESPYLDSEGRSICPIVAASCFINGSPDGKNARYGIVRDMIHSQDEYNAHRAQSLRHVVSRRLQRVEGSDAEYLDEETLKQVASDPRGVLPAGYMFVPDNALQEQIQLLQLSDSEMQRMGPTPAVLGRSLGASESGRSRQVQAAAGMTEIASILDRVERFEDGVYRMMWHQIRQYWNEEMYIRVTGSDRSFKFVTINRPKLDEQNPVIEQYVLDEMGQPQVDPTTGQPMTEQVPNIVSVENEVSKMDMDIIITVVPENVNLEHETWQQILQFCGSSGIVPGDPKFIMMLKLAPLSNKNDIIEKIETMMAEEAEKNAAGMEQQQQMQEMAGQLELQGKQTDIAKNAAHADKLAADADATRTETQTKATENALAGLLALNLGNPNQY